jgi:hypothetical protein
LNIDLNLPENQWFDLALSLESINSVGVTLEGPLFPLYAIPSVAFSSHSDPVVQFDDGQLMNLASPTREVTNSEAVFSQFPKTFWQNFEVLHGIDLMESLFSTLNLFPLDLLLHILGSLLTTSDLAQHQLDVLHRFEIIVHFVSEKAALSLDVYRNFSDLRK